ncbi:hypothetical protein BsWGS_17213 [Bradybaena similaris]
MMSPTLVLIVLIMFCLVEDARQQCPARSICKHTECLNVATEMLEAMDDSVDPCDDFYQFACGGWIKRQLLSEFSHRKRMTETYQALAKIRDLLVNDTVSQSSAERRAKALYKSCISDQPDKQKKTYEMIQNYFGRWTLACDLCEGETFILSKGLLAATQLGVHALFSLTVKPYVYKNTSGNTVNELKLHIGKPELGFSFAEYEAFRKDSEYIDIYGKHIVDVARRFGIAVNAVAKENARKIVEIEMHLVNLYNGTDEDSSELIPLAKLNEHFGQLMDWTAYISGIAISSNTNENNIKSTQTVVVSDKDYLKRVIDYFMQQPNRAQANYIIWRVIDTLRSVAINRDRKLYDILMWSMKTKTGRTFADMGCVLYVSKVFGNAIHRMMSEELPPPGEEEKVHSILQAVNKDLPLFLIDTEVLHDKSFRKSLKRAKRIQNEHMYKHEFDSNGDKYYMENLVVTSMSHGKETISENTTQENLVVTSMSPGNETIFENTTQKNIVVTSMSPAKETIFENTTQENLVVTSMSHGKESIFENTTQENIVATSINPDKETIFENKKRSFFQNLVVTSMSHDKENIFENTTLKIGFRDRRYMANVMLAQKAAFIRNLKQLETIYRPHYRSEPTVLPHELVVRYQPHNNKAVYTSPLILQPWFVEHVPE